MSHPHLHPTPTPTLPTSIFLYQAEAYPGQLLNLSIIGKDQFNNPTYVVVWLKDSSGTNFTGTIINDADSSVSQ